MANGENLSAHENRLQIRCIYKRERATMLVRCRTQWLRKITTPIPLQNSDNICNSKVPTAQNGRQTNAGVQRQILPPFSTE